MPRWIAFASLRRNLGLALIGLTVSTAALAEEPPPTPTPPVAAPTPPPIQRVDDDTYQVDRELIKRITGSPEAIGQLASAELEVGRPGAPAGVRLSDLPPKGFLAQIGLQDGDLLLSVNGHRLDSLAGAMAAYRSLMDTPELSLVLRRGGRTLTRSLRIR